MKRKMIFVAILIIALIMSNGYFISQSQKLDYVIQIGFPIQSKADSTMAVDFSKSQPLKKKEEVNIVLFSLIYADSMEESGEITELPDVVISISDPVENIMYCQVSAWLNDDAIIFKIGDESNYQYKKIENTYYMEQLKNIVIRHIDQYAGGMHAENRKFPYY